MFMSFSFDPFLEIHQDLHPWSYPVKPMNWPQPSPSLRALAFCSDLQALAAFGQSNQAVNWVLTPFGSQPFDSLLSHSHLNCFGPESLVLQHWEALPRDWCLSLLSGLSAELQIFWVTKVPTTQLDQWTAVYKMWATFQLNSLQVALSHVLCCDIVLIHLLKTSSYFLLCECLFLCNSGDNQY